MGQRPRLLNQRRHFLPGNPALALLARQAHLDKGANGFAAPFSLFVQFPGQLHAVQGLDEIEEIQRYPDLVALKMADHMPFHRSLDELSFGLRFLDIVFAEEPDPGLYRLLDAGDALRLGRGQEFDPARISAAFHSRLAYPLENLPAIGGDVDHGRLLNIISDPINHSRKSPKNRLTLNRPKSTLQEVTPDRIVSRCDLPWSFPKSVPRPDFCLPVSPAASR